MDDIVEILMNVLTMVLAVQMPTAKMRTDLTLVLAEADLSVRTF